MRFGANRIRLGARRCVRLPRLLDPGTVQYVSAQCIDAADVDAAIAGLLGDGNGGVKGGQISL